MEQHETSAVWKNLGKGALIGLICAIANYFLGSCVSCGYWLCFSCVDNQGLGNIFDDEVIIIISVLLVAIGALIGGIHGKRIDVQNGYESKRKIKKRMAAEAEKEIANAESSFFLEVIDERHQSIKKEGLKTVILNFTQAEKYTLSEDEQKQSLILNRNLFSEKIKEIIYTSEDMSNIEKNMIDFLVKRMNDTWICPNCHRENINYVFMCECGKKKRRR